MITILSNVIIESEEDFEKNYEKEWNSLDGLVLESKKPTHFPVFYEHIPNDGYGCGSLREVSKDKGILILQKIIQDKEQSLKEVLELLENFIKNAWQTKTYMV